MIYPPYEGGFFLKSRLPFPIGPLYIAAYLQERDMKAEVIDFSYPYNEVKIAKPAKLSVRRYIRRGWTDDAMISWFIDNLDKYHNVIGVSSLMSTMYQSGYSVVEMIKAIKPEAKIIMGGPHATIFPKHVAKKSMVDYILVGEGEEAMYKFLNGEKNIEGVYTKDEIIKNEVEVERAVVSDMNSLPFPDRKLLKDKRKTDEMMITFSRGCPAACSFCTSVLVQGRAWRNKTSDRAIEEIKFYHEEWGAKKFIIEDDNLCPGPKGRKWFMEVCDGVMGMKLKFNIPHGLPVEATANPELCKKAYAIGFRNMTFPVESTNLEVLKDMKKTIVYKYWRQAIKSWKYERKKSVEIILGYPFVETIDTMLQTVKDLSGELCTIWPSHFRPNKGIELFDRCVHAGYVGKKNFDPIIMNQISVETENFNTKDIKEISALVRGVNFGVDYAIDVFTAELKNLKFSGYEFKATRKPEINEVVAVGSFGFKKGQEVFSALLLKRLGVKGKPKIICKDKKYMIYVGSELNKVWDKL